MGQANDYGYGNINWNSTNLEHIKLAAKEYGKRWNDTQRDFTSIDTKARWALSFIFPVSVAVVGYIFAKYDGLNRCSFAALACLATMLSVGAFLCARATQLQNYDGEGLTPTNMEIDKWGAFITGGAQEEKKFYAVKIRELARAIDTNRQSNKYKSRRLKWGMRSAVFSPFVSGIILFLCHLP